MMPHDHGHRRAQSYFSGFTTSASQLGLPIDRAKSRSTAHLDKLQRSGETDLRRASSTQHLTSSPQSVASYIATSAIQQHQKHQLELRKLQIEEELEDRVQTLLRNQKPKYTSVTLPLSVRFSVTGDVPNKQPELSFATAPMARPRSPKTKDVDHNQMEQMLDQTLMSIRQQLNVLSNERAKMETQMEDLTSGIDTARQQCQAHCRRRSRANLPSTQYSTSSLRRARSSVPSRPSQLIRMSREETNGLNITAQSPVSSDSQDSLTQSPVYSSYSKTSHSESVSPTSSGFSYSYSSENRLRSDSASSSGSQVQPPRVFLTSLSQGNDASWLSNITIPELPESPQLSAPNSFSYKQSTPISKYSMYGTAPRRSKRPFSVSTSALPQKIISNPDISKKGLLRQENQPIQQSKLPLQHPKLSNRNSLPESAMNSILENQVDTLSSCDSLSQLSISQLSGCTEDGSPKNSGSTFIVRRSSLTGQIEHVRKPRTLTKRNSSFGASSEKLRMYKPQSMSVNNIDSTGRSSDSGFRVLNKGYRRSGKRRMKRDQIVLPCVETTV